MLFSLSNLLFLVESQPSDFPWCYKTNLSYGNTKKACVLHFKSRKIYETSPLPNSHTCFATYCLTASFHRTAATPFLSLILLHPVAFCAQVKRTDTSVFTSANMSMQASLVTKIFT